MSIFLVLMMNFLNIINSYNAFKNKSVSIIFWVSLFIFFNIPHTIDVFLTSSYYLSILNHATMFCLFFNLTFFVFDKIKINKRKVVQEIIVGPITVSRFDYIMLFILILSALIWTFGLYQASGSIIQATWSDMRAVDSRFMLLGNYLFIASASCTLLFFLSKRKIEFLSSLLLSIYIILIIKGRINIIPVVIPFIVYFIYSTKMNIKKVVHILLLSTLLVFLVFFLQQLRYLGSFDDFRGQSIQVAYQNTVDKLLSGQGEFNLRKAFYLFIENNNNYLNFENGNTYKRLIFWFIPSKILDFKPHDFAYDMWDAVYPHRAGTGGTFHPIFYGDAYANFGFLGFFISIFWVVVFRLFDNLMKSVDPKTKVALLSPLSIMYVLLARGAVYNSVVFCIWASLIIILISHVSKIRIVSKKNYSSIQ